MSYRKVILLVVPLLLVAACARQPQRPFTVVSWGGALQDAEREAYFQPFAKLTGREVRDLAFTGEYAKLKVMVQSGRVEWDVVETDSDIAISGGREGLLELIDYSIVPQDQLLPGYTRPHGVAVFVYSLALVWRKDLVPPTRQPSTWADMWNLTLFPGKRGFRNTPRGTLEIALLADGVPPDKLYPLDVDRALRKLSQIKKDIIWWSSGAEFEQKMTSELALAAGYNGRAFNLQRAGKSIGYTFEGGILDSDWWVVPRGTPYRQLAMQFIAQASSPSGQKLLAAQLAYGPISKTATTELPASVQEILPSSPANLARQVRFNSEWWAENEKAVLPQWESWLVEGPRTK
jgi:putative spermidine/putrescine transport system substrate-binding protein